MGHSHTYMLVLCRVRGYVARALEDKPFVFVASSRQGCADRIGGLVKKHNLTFPIYERFGLSQFERIGIH